MTEIKEVTEISSDLFTIEFKGNLDEGFNSYISYKGNHLWKTREQTLDNYAFYLCYGIIEEEEKWHIVCEEKSTGKKETYGSWDTVEDAFEWINSPQK